MSSHIPPSSSDASRSLSRSGILTPASDSSVNKSTAGSARLAPAPPKRKSDHALVPGSAKKPRHHDGRPPPMEELLKPSITVKPHPSSVFVKARTLLPLMLLPREHLPLSSLDLSSPHGDFQPCRRFESHIRIMELEGRLGSNVLVARSESAANAVAYVIEREENGLYVLCKLGSWVDLDALSRMATVLCRQRMRLPAAPTTSNGGAFEPPLVTPQVHRANTQKRLAIEEIQSLIRKRPSSQSLLPPRPGPAALDQQQSSQSQSQSRLPTLPGDETALLALGLSQDPSSLELVTAAPSLAEKPAALPPTPLAAADEALVEQPTADGIFQNIRSQYLEALYHSLGSLAYFAKGPLSRARAAFHLDCDSNLEMNDLIDFLKSLVMTTLVIDRKYRETVPEVIAHMKTLVETSDSGEAKAKKKRPRKKMKLGKDGLYPAEDGHVRRWWRANEPDLDEHKEEAVSSDGVRYHVSCLRTRETQLQMILVLEILALETMRPPDDALDSQLPGLERPTPPKPTPTFETAPKRRKKPDFPVLMDIHADRLCIWQSITLDEVKALAESQPMGDVAGKSDKATSTSDPLHDFCVDIIIPFFSSRLPELCDSLSRKLGGPVIVSPPKLKSRNNASDAASKPRQKPGSAATRPAPPKASKSLDRVLSNELLRRSLSRGPTDAIAHMRSATVAPIPGLKREMSEPLSASGIPRRNSSGLLLAEKAANAFRKSGGTATGSDDQRAKKKALVDAELQDAISALKKPNRELAGKAIVEAAERRLFGGPALVGKPKKPGRNPLDRVQVKATPVNSRYRDALAAADGDKAMATITTSSLLRAPEPDFVPSSGLRRDSKQQQQQQVPTSPRVASTPSVGRVEATPARSRAAPARLPKALEPTDFVPTSSPMANPNPKPKPKPEPRRSLGEPVLPRQARLMDDVVVTSSPVRMRKSVAPVPRSNGSAGPDAPPSGSDGLFQTPARPKARRPGGGTAEAQPQPRHAAAPAAKKERTIYQQLGWDDDDED